MSGGLPDDLVDFLGLLTPVPSTLSVSAMSASYNKNTCCIKNSDLTALTARCTNNCELHLFLSAALYSVTRFTIIRSLHQFPNVGHFFSQAIYQLGISKD